MTAYEAKQAEFKEMCEVSGYIKDGKPVPESGYYGAAYGFWEYAACTALNQCERLQAQIDKLEANCV